MNFRAPPSRLVHGVLDGGHAALPMGSSPQGQDFGTMGALHIILPAAQARPVDCCHLLSPPYSRPLGRVIQVLRRVQSTKARGAEVVKGTFHRLGHLQRLGTGYETLPLAFPCWGTGP